MEWKEIGNSIVSMAPALGGLLAPVTGGVSAGIGAGIAVLGKAFGLGENPSPEELKTAIAADKDASLKIMVAENEFKLRKRDQDIDEMKALLADTQSARTRQVESEKATGKVDGNLYAMAWLGVLGYLALIVYLIAYGLPKMSVELALMVGNLIGIVGAKYSSIFDYFFGASKSSVDKAAFMVKSESGSKEPGK